MFAKDTKIHFQSHPFSSFSCYFQADCQKGHKGGGHEVARLHHYAPEKLCTQRKAVATWGASAGVPLELTRFVWLVTQYNSTLQSPYKLVLFAAETQYNWTLQTPYKLVLFAAATQYLTVVIYSTFPCMGLGTEVATVRTCFYALLYAALLHLSRLAHNAITFARHRSSRLCSQLPFLKPLCVADLIVLIFRRVDLPWTGHNTN